MSNNLSKSALAIFVTVFVSIPLYLSVSSAAAQNSAESLDYEIANGNVLSDSRFGECLERGEVDLTKASIRIDPNTEKPYWHSSYTWFVKYSSKLDSSFSVEEIFVCSDLNDPVNIRLHHRFTGDELEELLQVLYLPDVPRDQKIVINGKLVSPACSTVGFSETFMVARLEANVFAIVEIPSRQCGFMISPVQEVLWKTYDAHGF